MATLDFAVTVRLLDQLTGPLKSVTKATTEANQQFSATKQRLAELNAVQKNLDGYKQLKQQLAGTTQKLTEAQEKAKQLALKFKEAENPSKRLTQQFEKARASVNALQQKQLQQIRTLDQLRGKITSAGTPMRSLLEAERHLRSETAAANRTLESQKSILDQVAARSRKVAESQKAIASARKAMDAGLSRSSNMMISGMGGVYGAKSVIDKTIMPVLGTAITDEAAFASVKKVVDFLNPEEAQQFRQELGKLSIDLRMLPPDLYAIAAAGGQLGVAKDQLKSFSSVTAMMATAFDMSAEQAGDSAAKIANVYQIPITQIEDVGDAINHLSNNTAAKASELVDVLTRVGGTSKQFGLTAIQAAALGDAMLALGKTPEVAGTGIKALLMKMQTATIQAKPFQKGLAKIGITAEQLETKVRKNGQAALIDFLKTLEKLPDSKRMNVIGELFGAEYADDISALVGGLNNYEKALNLVGDAGNYAFSMQLEFENKVSTTEGNIKQLNSAMYSLKNEAGSALLPVLNDIIAGLKPIIEKTMDWARANPETVKTLMLIVGGVAAMIAVGGSLTVMLASLIGPFAVLRYGASILGIRLGIVKTAFSALGRVLPIVGRALLFIGRAALLNPIGLAITVIVAGAIAIYKNWDKIIKWWNNSELKEWMVKTGALDYAKAKIEQLKNWWDNTSFIEKGFDIATAPIQIAKVIAKDLFDWWSTTEFGKKTLNIGTEAIEWARAKIEEFKSWWNNTTFSQKSVSVATNIAKASVAPASGAFGIGQRLGKWLTGDNSDGARASGGPVRAGGIYRVNELGPELLKMRGQTYLMADNDANVIPLRNMVKRTNQHLFGEQGNGQRGQVVDFQQHRQELKTSGVLHIKIDSKEPVRVTRMQSSGMQLNVHTGPIGAIS